MKTATLNLIAHHTDNRDGSTSVLLYNSREELFEGLLVVELDELV